MYKTIVRAKVKALFEEANRGNWQAIVDNLSDRFQYRFVGDSPLGGTRTSKPAMRAWFGRIYKLFPDAKLTPQTIVVEGFPWSTQVMTYVKFSGSLPSVNGSLPELYENEVMQLMHLRWGRINSVLTIEDTQRFVDILPRLGQAGIKEASAAPING